VEAQDVQALGTVPGTVTVGGTGEFVLSSLNWSGPIVAQAGGAISGDNGNSTFSGPITANGQFSARARDFYSTGTARTLTISGAISGSGGMIAQGPTAGTGRVLIAGNNSAWTGALQVDPGTQAVVSVGFGAGATTSLPTGDLTLNGGRLTITPSIGTGLTTTSGISGRWVNYGVTAINDTFATPWFVNTAATRTDAVIDFANLAGIDTVTGLPGAGALPQGVGLAATTAFIDRYAVVYNGLLNITTGGSYTFTVPSDDGASLFIDGQQVVANEGGHGIGTIGTGTVTLAPGQHQITLKNTNGGTGGGIQLAYQGPDQPTAPITGGTGVTNMAVTGVVALTNVTGGLSYTLTNTITVPNQVAATNTTLETSGFDTTSNGAMTVGDNGTIIFASATSHSFTQVGAVTLGANSGLASVSQAVTVPITTTLTPANVLVTGNVLLNGNANLNADAAERLTVNCVIDDGAGSFGITKNSGAGTVILGGTSANTFEGAFNVGQGILLLNKPAGVNAIGVGGLNLDTSIATGTAAIDYAVVRLMANEQIADSSTLNVLTHNTVGFGATLDLNNFTETVSSLNLRGATANMGRIVMGPTGKLIVNGDITLTNNRNAAGNTGREALITGIAPTGNALNLFAPGTGTLDLGVATRNVTATTTVTQSNTDSTIDSIITNGGITKVGGQRLVLNGSNPIIGRNSTFSGGIALNDGVLRGGGIGAQTSSAFGTGILTINKGLTTASGGITAGGATLELRNNTAAVNLAQGGTAGAIFVGQSVNNVVNYGNNVTVAGAVTTWGVDVNNYRQLQNGQTITGSGGELRLGTLTTSGPLQLNVTGSNNYSLAFNGLALGGALTLNATSANIRLNNLSGANNISTIAGATGNVIVGGNGSTFSGNVNVAAAGTLRLAPTIGIADNLFGTGTFTTAANPTIGISPVVAGGTLTPGTPGGLTARFYNLDAGGINFANFSTLASGVTSVSLLSEGAITNRPPTVTGTSFTNGIVVYSGLLNIATAGDYSFQTFVDDESQLVIDGMPVISVNTGGGGTGIIHSPVSAPFSLTAGLHTITMKVLNNGGAGGVGVSYNGADSGNVMRPIPSSALQSVAPLVNVANSGINQSIAAAGSLTLDGGGTDLDGGINDLTFAGATGTLNVTNAGGTGTITVSGTTSFGANTPTFNPTSGKLALIGDVTGSGAITKSGSGALVLAGAKSFTGQLTINAGAVQVTDPASLGAIAAGTATTSVAPTLSSTTTNGNAIVTVASTATLFAGQFVSGTGIPAGASILAVNSATTFTLSANATASATNTLTYTSGSTVDLNGVALGAEPLSLIGGGTAIIPAALYNSSTGAASASGPITLTGAANIGGLGDITLLGALSGNFVLTKNGPSTLTISGSNSSTAGITVAAGLLKVNNASALGTTAGTTTVSVGGVLDLNGFSLAEPLNITGAGTTNFGSMNSLASLINTGAAVTQSGNVVLGGAATIGSNSLGAGGDITISGVISAAQALSKAGGNTLTLTGSNTYTGATTVNYGTLTVSGAGVISTQASLTVNPTATVNYDYTAANTAKNGAHAINLIGGNLNLIGNAADTTEAIGANNITANSNQSVITLSPSATGSLTLSSTNNLVRANNGLVLICGTNLGNAIGPNVAQVTFGGSAQTIGQIGADGSKNRAIIPWAIVDQNAAGNGSSFAKIGVNGAMALDASEYDIDTITGPNNILAAATNVAAPAGTTLINSLTLTGAGSVSIGAGNTLQLDSGAIGSNASTSISGAGTLSAGISQSNNLREIVAYTSGALTSAPRPSLISSSGITRAWVIILDFTFPS
jgi:fibronectin-binding autotransporter adhesin